ncbi:MAG TPA: lysine biosynthesis protein LysX [Anaerolineales bacterium]|nr:lysine biosynthesis protein LysX [Anaerolineales bacterium]HRK91547.1 lysine biosynthesis protein LysX [Anaerolineales bacterium]
MQRRLKIGVLYSRVRVEEKWIFGAMEKRGIDYDRLDDRAISFDLEKPEAWQQYDAVLERSISYNSGLYALRMLNAFGVPTVNTAAVAEVCGDKLMTSAVLARDGVPQPHNVAAFSTEAALEAIEAFGYPVVLKPVVGSWGRLLAKINDRDAAEAVLEHKSTLGSVQHSVFYIQEFIEKPGRDLRIIMIGDKVLTGMYRSSEHWITNTARGGSGELCPITPEIEDICLRASKAVGGGLLGVDLVEHPEKGLVVNEINHTMEFHTMQPVSGLDIAGEIVDYVVKVAKSSDQ